MSEDTSESLFYSARCPRGAGRVRLRDITGVKKFRQVDESERILFSH